MLFSLVLATILLAAANASSPGSTSLFHLQCRRRHAHPSKRQEKSTRSVGSLICIQRPTAERVSRWFRRETMDDGAADCFNHDEIGMTNPCLHVDLRNHNHIVDSSSSSNRVVQVSSNSSKDRDCWWPDIYPSSCSNGWKSLVFRRRIGWGLSCYKAVRDAALEWEFPRAGDDNDDDDGSEKNPKGAAIHGIVQIHSPPRQHSRQLYHRRDTYGTGYDVVHNMCFGDGNLYESPSQRAIQIWSGPGGRRLATYTRVFATNKWWLPKLYCVNPVSVVYDLVDQRGPGTTYTSTAYATCRGHWLRGEERVTVAHRDDGDVDVEIVSYSKHGNTLWGRIIWPFVGPLQERFFESQMHALESVAAQHSGRNDEARSAMLLNVNTFHGAARRGRTSSPP